MDFTTTPPEPLAFGHSPEHYRRYLKQCSTHEFADDTWIMGKIELGGNEYVVHMIRWREREDKHDITELRSLLEGDTFMGISTAIPTSRFRNELKRHNISFETDGSLTKLPQYSIEIESHGSRLDNISWIHTLDTS